MPADWRIATLIKSEAAAQDVKALTFSVEGWPGHKAGQHCDVRLTAPNGYQAERSYSIASPPEAGNQVEFGVQLLKDGEVSPYLFDLQNAEQVELRGPIGGHFVWDANMPGPLLLIGGGSGMVPLMSMLRHHMLHLDTHPGRRVIFLISARTLGHVLYKEELEECTKRDPNLKIVMTLTHEAPPDWQGYRRLIDKEMLQETFGGLQEAMPMAYICGPTPFVEAVANALVADGFHSHEIRTERFGG